MKKFLTFISGLLSLILFAPSTFAIENGKDASGSAYVVPIKTQYSATNVTLCSGVLIASSIVATAGHCVLNSDGLMTNKVYVGDPGSSMDSISTSDVVSSVQITPSFKNGVGNTVGVDDIVFLVLGKPKVFNGIIRLASEAEVQSLKSKTSPLKLFGYGAINDIGDAAKFPFSTEGSFSATPVASQPDSAVVQPISNPICKGDSGGPVLSITATEILVVGVITGGDLRKNCGSSYAIFTLVSRYSNLAFASAVTQMINLETQVKKTTDDANQGLRSAEALFNSKYDALQKESKAQQDIDQANIDELNARIEELEAQVVKLQDLLPKTISCVKGKAVKKITAVKAKCPAGYSIKS
ncbi:Serine proteases, trypsin domain containing protein [Candidatus Nanopelagicaceae bacterium]